MKNLFELSILQPPTLKYTSLDVSTLSMYLKSECISSIATMNYVINQIPFREQL